MYIVLTLTHKETKKFIRKNKLNSIHRKALKKNEGIMWACINDKIYYIEDRDLIRKRYR